MKTSWKSSKLWFSFYSINLLFILAILKNVDGVGFISGMGTILFLLFGANIAEKRLIK